ncbi:MAG: tetratricopeptide repeat protein [Bacillota bacterium]
MKRLSAVAGVVIVAACAANAPKPADDWHAYQAETAKSVEAARFRDALKSAQQELAAAEKTLPADSPELSTALMDLAYVERETGAYTDAAAHYRRALDIRKAKFGAESPQAAEVQEGLARNIHLTGDLPAALEGYKAALAIQERLLPKDDPALGLTLTDYGRALADYNDNDTARQILDRALAIREQHPGPGKRDLAFTLNQSAYLSIMSGDDDGAEKTAQRSLAIMDVSGAGDRPELAEALDLSGNVDLDRSHFPDAEPKFRRCLDMYTQLFGPDHQNVANAQNDIARTYDDEGHYPQAEDYYNRSIATYTRALGADNVNLGSITGNLAQMQDNTGEYQQAEANFKRAIDIDSHSWTHDRINMAFDYNNYAQLYRLLGQNEQAEALLQQALAIFQKLLPPDHTYVLTVLNNIGELYTEEEKYSESVPYFTQVIAIGEKTLSPDDPALATWYNNLAEAYEGEHKYADAEALYRKAYAITLKTLGPEHAMTAQYSQNLANLLNLESKFSEAEARYPAALAIFKKTYGPRHSNIADLEFDWAVERFHAGDRKGASPLFDDYFDIMHAFFLAQYRYMKESDRLQLLARSKDAFPTYFSFCLDYHAEDPALAAKMYDILLWQKGLVGNSIAALRAKIAASGDAEAVSLLGRLGDLKAKLAQLLNNPGDDHAQWESQVSQLQAETDGVEQQLLARSQSFTREQSLEKISWRDVQKGLKPGEAAVEFAHFNYLNGTGHTKTDYYVALVLTHETRDAPEFIVVGKAEDLESGPVADYAARLSKFGTTAATSKTSFYQAFWKPLEPALKGTTRVYLSPDGILNQASLGIVPDEQGRLLMERYDLRIVPSTRDVLRAPPATASDTAVLLGGPAFDLKPDRYLAAVAKLNVPGAAETRYAGIRGAGLPVARDLSAGGKCPLPDTGILCPLPGAAQEVSDIDGLLTRKQWQASLYQGEQGLEEAIQAAHHPRLLHIATHGFFLPDQRRVRQDPMLRSGLYFAGADNALAGNPPPAGADSGVLTAYEAAQLDLEGTELVVLSACDTGLGTSAGNGEGVFGLNRALQEAGAQAVVMSMWSVPDQETRELMQLFYANWLGGMEKHEALRQAELKEREVVKARYGQDLPYYWGAFVMVGR